MTHWSERRVGRESGRAGPIAYDEPFAWWGPVWQTPPRRSVLDLVRDGTLPISWAAALWALLARRASIVVAAGPRGAGKTTVLTALLDLYPAETRRIYLRGCYEPFLFLDQPRGERERSLILVNEISAHLPVYLWGPGVARALAAIGQGYALAATAHASDAAGFVGSLVGYPLRVPPSVLAGVDLLVLLGGGEGGPGGRIESIWMVGRGRGIEPGGNGLRLEPLATDRDRAPDISLVIQKWSHTGTEAGLEIRDELRGRTAFLEELRGRGAGTVEREGRDGGVAAMLASFRPVMGDRAGGGRG